MRVHRNRETISTGVVYRTVMTMHWMFCSSLIQLPLWYALHLDISNFTFFPQMFDNTGSRLEIRVGGDLEEEPDDTKLDMKPAPTLGIADKLTVI